MHLTKESENTLRRMMSYTAHDYADHLEAIGIAVQNVLECNEHWKEADETSASRGGDVIGTPVGSR